MEIIRSPMLIAAVEPHVPEGRTADEKKQLQERPSRALANSYRSPQNAHRYQLSHD